MEMLSGGATQGGGSAVGGASYPTAMSIFFHVVAFLFVLVLLQRCLPRWWKPFALTTPELSVIYAAVSIGTAVAGVDMLQVLVPITAYPIWFATPENEWQELFLGYLPNWWTVDDRGILNGFYRGGDKFHLKKHIVAWLPIVVAWISFLTAMIFVTSGLSAILRRQWVEHERLTYPITQLPLSLLDPKTQLFKSYPFWFGFVVTASITFYNGLAYLFPNIPILIWSLNLRFTDYPWNAIGSIPLRIFPFVVSMAFLIPHELSFSCWFFYWLMKGLKVLGVTLDWRNLPEFPYSRHQSFGAYMGIFAFALFAGRRHFMHALVDAYRSIERKIGDPISMRVAFIYVILGGIYLIGFAAYAGMSVWVATFFFVLYFMLSVGISRIRAELGAPVHDFHHLGPQKLVVLATGTRLVGNQNLTLLAIFSWFNRAYRCHPMPIQLESLKLAQAQQFHTRRIFFA
ncbi:MAG TPA: hypothetical protein EYN27_05235, partial [Rhodospirillales bacterium]|nr:hypothetical protein [Rhodospirillales bacterium]HIO38336.1 hypothetical protein [Rhodospirillales bacterium]